MSYQVLARKWRPQEFSELIGQEPIVQALENALRDERIAQAYLFAGIRGVGKTTAARLLAKALNRGSASEDSRAGREIVSSGDLDVIEVDAATYSKVEQVRELTESLQYAPAGSKYKVVIIDEIHRLSRQAFDALLKIVEEPPPHLVFIFATTEIEAVPATILSRCQEFHFRRVPAAALAGYLRKIADAEEITVSDTALRLIARAGEGSVRDSVALLDQLGTFGSGSIDDQDAVRLLGGLDTTLFEDLLDAILGGESARISEIVRNLEADGHDPRSAFTQFLSYCRDALHVALGSDPTQIDLPADEVERLTERARAAGYENLLRMLNQLLQSEQVVRRSEAGALALEVAWLRAAELPKLVQIERILAAGAGGGGGAKPPESRGRSGGSDVSGARGAKRAAPRPPAPRSPAPRSSAKPPRRQQSKPSRKPTASKPPQAPAVEQAASANAGPNAELLAEVEKNPTVQAVLDVFGGRIERVEKTEPVESAEPDPA